MSDFETRVEMAELNKELAELWMDEMDLYEIHHSACLEVENRCVKAYNAMGRQRNHYGAITHGARLRKVFGYE